MVSGCRVSRKVQCPDFRVSGEALSCLLHAGIDRDLPGAREREGAGGTADGWDTREFCIKWKRWSYMHTSWETREALAQLGGYKRVLNYIKRVDEAEVRYSPLLSPCALVAAYACSTASMRINVAKVCPLRVLSPPACQLLATNSICMQALAIQNLSPRRCHWTAVSGDKVNSPTGNMGRCKQSLASAEHHLHCSQLVLQVACTN